LENLNLTVRDDFKKRKEEERNMEKGKERLSKRIDELTAN
jgi:hypothetical protein